MINEITVTKDYILYDSIHMKYLELANTEKVE